MLSDRQMRAIKKTEQFVYSLLKEDDGKISDEEISDTEFNEIDDSGEKTIDKY